MSDARNPPAYKDTLGVQSVDTLGIMIEALKQVGIDPAVLGVAGSEADARRVFAAFRLMAVSAILLGEHFGVQPEETSRWLAQGVKDATPEAQAALQANRARGLN